MTILRGCDVSTFQSPALVNWSNYDFGIVRSTYGSRVDGKVEQHASKIRAAGKTLGLYHFFLPKTGIQAQLDAFCSVAKKVSLGDGDILPCVDIEAYPDQFKGAVATHWAQVDPSWNEPLVEFVMLLEKEFGRSIPYITQRDWSLLGKPEWVLQRPLWVANYPKKGSTSPLKAPATPGLRPYAIWQLMVGPLNKTLQDHTSPVAVDQNIAPAPLPLIQRELGVAPTEPATNDQMIDETTIPWVALTDEDWDEMREARDHQLRDV
jgi:GH25 family lysozyme M1 (1,4-beta-N-acetylmuramidase)